MENKLIMDYLNKRILATELEYNKRMNNILRNMEEDKYVDINKVLLIEFVFNIKFKKWVPIRVVDNSYKIVHISKLIQDNDSVCNTYTNKQYYNQNNHQSVYNNKPYKNYYNHNNNQTNQNNTTSTYNKPYKNYNNNQSSNQTMYDKPYKPYNNYNNYNKNHIKQ